MKKLVGLLVCVSLLLIALGCSRTEEKKSGSIRVVASIYPVYQFTKAVAGEQATVEMLVPAGAEAHDWEPSAGEIKKINTADVFLFNGGGMEPWAQKLAETAQDRKTIVVETGEGLFSLQRASGHTDPHIWLDPVLAQAQVTKIKEALIQADAKNKELYEKNAADFIQQLEQLDSECRKLSESTEGKAFITMHAAFSYLAERYGWQQIPLMGISPHAEPNPAQIAKIMQTTQDRGLKYIFVEPNISDKIMQEIASETNTQVLYLDTLEAQGKSDSGYLARMRSNLKNLAISFQVTQ